AVATELAGEPEVVEQQEAEPESMEPEAFVVDEPEVVAEPEPVEEPEALVADEPALEDEPELEEEETEEDVVADVAPAAAPVPLPPVRHTFDPLGGGDGSRRRWRKRDEPYVDVPALPRRPTALPGSARRK